MTERGLRTHREVHVDKHDGMADQFGSLLLQYRKHARLTQRELAGLSTVSLRTIRNLEAGRGVNPRPGTVRLLAEGLRLNASSRATLNLAVGQDGRDSALAAALDKAPGLAHEAGREPLGRDQEINCALDIIRSGTSRIVTIGGLGGAGKSRLALAVARAAQDKHQLPWLWLPSARAGERDGASQGHGPLDDIFAEWSRDFAAGSDHAVDALARVIARRPFLLILDDVTGTATAVEAALPELLRRCPGLAIVETTRRPLGRGRRQVLPLRPLALRGPAGVDPIRAEMHPALHLLIMNRAAQADFELRPENIGYALQVCSRLDGLPRALEAAAAWFTFYPPRQVADLAASEPYALARPPGDNSGMCWVSAALTEAMDGLSWRQAALLTYLAGRAQPWTLDQIAVSARMARGDVVESLHTFLSLGLIRPADGGSEDLASFVMLNLVQRFVREMAW
jgi:transcriptional regulator with XRE-family HTH domain